jgi:hypothetical protein
VAGHAVGSDEFLCVLTQYFSDLAGRPDKELALFALAVGVLRAVNPPGGIRHLPHNIVQDFLRDGAEELVVRDLLGVQIDAGQLGIVI